MAAGLDLTLHIFANVDQEGYLASHAVNDEDRIPVAENDAPMDPMQGLEGLDVAGPKAG